MPPTYYQLLGVARTASAQEIKSAYHRLIQRHHPDHSSDPASATMSARLNEAYWVLRDSNRRALYDASLSEATNTPRAEERHSGTKRTPEAQVVCANCGVQDSTLRFAAMYYVMSFLIITQRRRAAGLWCSRCRAKAAAKWTVLSIVLGWWGFPWGFVYTLQALYMNAIGGEQSRENNAVILRVVGFQLYSNGDYEQAAIALRSSLRLCADLDAE